MQTRYAKLAFLPARLVKFFKSKDTADSQVQIQAAIVLGSFAYGLKSIFS